MVARDRNPTQTRLSIKGNLLAYSVQKDAKYLIGKKKRLKKLEKKRLTDSRIFSLRLLSLHVAGKMASSRRNASSF